MVVIILISLLGIIPTRVGTRWYLSHNRRTSWDHPHACGDKYSSGTLFIVNDGIIPTRVGTSGAGDVDYGAEGDHPHACGDKKAK